VFIVKARTIDGWIEIFRSSVYVVAFAYAVTVERDYADIFVSREV
jgi:hypothetical protein